MWTGAGAFQPTGTPDAVLNGKTFVPDSVFADMSDILEDEGIGGPLTVILQGHDLDDGRLVCPHPVIDELHKHPDSGGGAAGLPLPQVRKPEDWRFPGSTNSASFGWRQASY